MALKTKLTEREQYGLTQEEIKLATKYLRKFKTAGIIGEIESLKLFELFLIGSSFRELQQQFPQHELAKIMLTASLRGWLHDREAKMGSLQERVRAKVIKSILEQVDFLSTMLSVSNTEHMDAMRRYIINPAKNPAPEMRAKTIKEYGELVNTLQKIMTGSTPGSKTPSIIETLSQHTSDHQIENLDTSSKKKKVLAPADAIAAELGIVEDE